MLRKVNITENGWSFYLDISYKMNKELPIKGLETEFD